MTFSPKVWGDALRRLQNDTPDFAFDAWIAPLQVKLAKDQATGGDRVTRTTNGDLPIGLNIGGLIAFSVITETVFQWPGTGLMFIQAVDFVDVPIMAAYLVFVALLFVLINLVVDILYLFIDPRIRLGD